MKIIVPVVALAAAAMLGQPASAQDAPRTLFSTHSPTVQTAAKLPKAHLSLSAGPELRLPSPVQQFWQSAPSAAGDLSRIDDRADIPVATFAMHF
jgi:hypothetical protein